MPTSSRLDNIFSQAPRRVRGCNICGMKNTGRIVMQIREYGPNNTDVGGRSITRTYSLCNLHLIEIWESVEGKINAYK